MNTQIRAVQPGEQEVVAAARTTAAPGTTAALRTTAASKRYGDTLALADASFEVAKGSCTALVGESGCGKTTLLRCFNRMAVPDEGLVEVNGADVAGLNPVSLRRQIGYVQQEGGLIPHWSVLRNAAMVPWLCARADAGELGRQGLELVGLSAERFGDRMPHELSGGQRQRVAIARALAVKPSIILLDEPFGALDAITRSQVRQNFDRLRRQLGVTALLVTHDLHEAWAVADRVAVMRRGGIVQTGTPEEIAERPKNDFVEQLLALSGVGAKRPQ